MGAHLENDGGLAVLAVELPDFLQHAERRRHCVDWPREGCCHYAISKPSSIFSQAPTHAVPSL